MSADLMQYCPACGAKSLQTNDKKHNCTACGFEFFMNVAAAVAGFIEYENKVLVTVRRFDPQKGALDLPGGFADRFESIEDALRREIREELNIELGDLHYLGSSHNRYPYKGVTYHTLDGFFVARALSLDGICVADDITDFKWLSLHELKPELFPFASIADGVRMYLAYKQA